MHYDQFRSTMHPRTQLRYGLMCFLLLANALAAGSYLLLWGAWEMQEPIWLSCEVTVTAQWVTPGVLRVTPRHLPVRTLVFIDGVHVWFGKTYVRPDFKPFAGCFACTCNLCLEGRKVCWIAGIRTVVRRGSATRLGAAWSTGVFDSCGSLPGGERSTNVRNAGRRACQIKHVAAKRIFGKTGSLCQGLRCLHWVNSPPEMAPALTLQGRRVLPEVGRSATSKRASGHGAGSLDGFCYLDALCRGSLGYDWEVGSRPSFKEDACAHLLCPLVKGAPTLWRALL
jgi:hypothetical protein